jgi:hypothetical protein
MKQNPEAEPVIEMAKAKVMRGHTIHVPTGRQKIVGTRPYEKDGVILHRDVTAQENRMAVPGDIIELPVDEIERLTALGFVAPLDDAPAKGIKVKPARPEIGVHDDPRVKGSKLADRDERVGPPT